MRLVRDPDWRLVAFLLALCVLLWAGIAFAYIPSDGAREGEPLPARVDRLRAELAQKRAEVADIETALRLSVAEMRVRSARR